MMTDTFVFRRLSADDAAGNFQRVAALHSELIHGGVLPMLGERFLAVLYREIAGSPWGSLHVALLHDEMVGFVAGTRNLWRCIFSFTSGGYLRLALRVALRMWRPALLRKVVNVLAYPLRQPVTVPAGLPGLDRERAELLAIAVSPAMQGRGVGRALIHALEETLRPQVKRYYVATNAADDRSNAFYTSLGFCKTGQQRHHVLQVQIYSKQLD